MSACRTHLRPARYRSGVCCSSRLLGSSSYLRRQANTTRRMLRKLGSMVGLARRGAGAFPGGDPGGHLGAPWSGRRGEHGRARSCPATTRGRRRTGGRRAGVAALRCRRSRIARRGARQSRRRVRAQPARGSWRRPGRGQGARRRGLTFGVLSVVAPPGGRERVRGAGDAGGTAAAVRQRGGGDLCPGADRARRRGGRPGTGRGGGDEPARLGDRAAGRARGGAEDDDAGSRELTGLRRGGAGGPVVEGLSLVRRSRGPADGRGRGPSRRRRRSWRPWPARTARAGTGRACASAPRPRGSRSW